MASYGFFKLLSTPGVAVPTHQHWPLGDAILGLNPSGRGGVHPPELPPYLVYMPTEGHRQLNVLQYELMRALFLKTSPYSQQQYIFFRSPSWLRGMYVVATLQNATKPYLGS